MFLAEENRRIQSVTVYSPNVNLRMRKKSDAAISQLE